jgi:hypothetical protein
MESYCLTKTICNPFNILLFRNTPRGWGIRTAPLSRIRHFTRLNATLSFPAELFFGGAW